VTLAHVPFGNGPHSNVGHCVAFCAKAQEMKNNPRNMYILILITTYPYFLYKFLIENSILPIKNAFWPEKASDKPPIRTALHSFSYIT
jgi:hypothetical protein